MKKNPCLLGCDPTLAFTNTSVPFWNVIVLYDSLICWRTSGMLSYCMSQWHVNTILGCDQTVGWTDKSVHFWDKIILWFRYMSEHFRDVVPSLTHRYPSMWSCCRIHCYISTDVRCDPTVCFTDMSVHFCDVIILYVSLICQYTTGCDPTVRFADT
jgi:hypothetical protein